MRRIPLTQGQFALVDDELYDELAQWKWYANWDEGIQGFYAKRSVRLPNGRQTKECMHRRITGFRWRLVDHINHNTLDNVVENLRDGSGSGNSRNQSPWRRRPVSSPYKGVSLHAQSGKWQASIRDGRRIRYLGLYTDEVEAALVYDRASREFHGDYGMRNFEEVP